ncbi:NADP-dependent oxidoreductase domain-containing protein [Lactifluus subvellereus]|nr:NADP-dependent oxidoreductase domain-containing protein [Lactifluus subvellereus]
MAPLYSLPPPPPTKLGRYRTLSPLAGVRVSPLQLGAMSIGDKWQEHGMGSMDKESSFKLLDAYFDAGGNFIDTANHYQDESSEDFIGEWAEKRGIRDQLVIATKYTTNFKRGQNDITHQVNYTGNNAKSLRVSVEASLTKLRTSYIDLLYVHWWDYNTSVEEVVDSLHTLVLQGKFAPSGYFGFSRVGRIQGNQYAKDHGKTPFSVYQGNWSILERSFERDIIPMARSEGLALLHGASSEAVRFVPTLKKLAARRAARKVARFSIQLGAHTRREKESITAVAIAYHLQKLPYVFPIIGGRKVEQLRENIAALDISLTTEQMERIENASHFNPGFPNNMAGDGTSDNFFLRSAGHLDRVPVQQAIIPAKQ